LHGIKERGQMCENFSSPTSRISKMKISGKIPQANPTAVFCFITDARAQSFAILFVAEIHSFSQQ